MPRQIHTWIPLVLGLTLAGCSQAESAPAFDTGTAAAAQPVVPFVPTGATLTFAIVDEISTKSAKAGDPFSARLLTDFTSEQGEVILPAGVVLHGTVTESLESPKNEEPAIIRLSVGTIETSSGTLILVGDVEELQMETDAKDTNTLSAGKVVAGAAAGTIIGKVAGKTKTGAAVGTAGGVALALATRDGHATVPAGSRMVVRLTEQLSVR